MIAPRWKKVIRDLWSNRTRTLLVVFSIAIGVAAIGTVASTKVIIDRELPANYKSINPMHAKVLLEPFDDDLLVVLRRIDGVEEIEGRRNLNVRMQMGDGEWRDLELIVIKDFNDIRINKITPESGKWPPEKDELLIERSSLVLTEKAVGDTLLVEAPNGRQRELKIVGLAHDLTTPAGTFNNRVKGYIDFETLEVLGYDKDYNELLVRVQGEALTRPEISEVMKPVESKIEKSGRSIGGTIIPIPGQHWFESYLTPMSALLVVLGVVILILSALLIINTISAMMSQQVRQIGMMKAIGARTGQLIVLYESSMLLIGLIAFAIALPLSAIGARFIVNVLAGIINFTIIDLSIPVEVMVLQGALCILVPILVALVPILSGANITVREAINDYGLTKADFGEGFIDHMISYVKGLPRPL
jgi:putative ABC transport system permease protein